MKNHVKHDSLSKLVVDKVCFNNSMIESNSNNNIVMVSATNASVSKHINTYNTPIQPAQNTMSAKRAQINNYKKTLTDMEKLMDEVNSYNEKVQA